MNTKPIYNSIQNVFVLNMYANLTCDKKAPQPQLQSDLRVILQALFSNKDLQKYLGQWEVVWGPVVASYGDDEKNKVTSNALYVAKNQDNQYVIATAGTNPISLYGWFIEDFDVRTMVAWDSPAGGSENAMISSGTSTGLNKLLGMQDSGVTLMDFLQTTFGTCTTQTQLAVTGHSLGGALSSVLALYVNERINDWNPANSVIVSALPSAGASPGNKAFSDYFNQAIGLRTLRFWNKLDPVPHGWQPDMVEEMPFLYYPYLKPGPLLQATTAMVLAQSLEGTATSPAGGLYTQLELQTPPLPGQVNIGLTRNPSASATLKFFIDMGAKEILNKLGVKDSFAKIIVDALNILLAEFAGEETLVDLMDKIRARVGKFLSHEPFFEKLLILLEKLFIELQNIVAFLMQLGYQHVTTYADLMGTASSHALSQSIINNAVKAGQLDSSYTNVMDRLMDPARTPILLASRFGTWFQKVLTPEFVSKHDLTL
jgi:hypothetical protein